MRIAHSIQGRLLGLVLGLVVVIWFVTAMLAWVDVCHELDELLDSHLAQAAALLVVQQAREVEDDDRGLDAPTLHRYAPKVAFQVFHEGRLAMRSSNAPVMPMLDLGGRATQGFADVEIAATRWRVFAAHGRERDVQVFVGEQLESRGSILRAVLRSALGPLLLAVPLLALAVWWSVRQGVSPLRRLGITLAERRPQDLQSIAVDGMPAEMKPMLHALNGLFSRIAQLMDSERRFTADAAHELRTPIAGIRAQAQVALAATADAERTHALQSTLQGCDRATRLIGQLLTLARLEAGISPESSAVDLASVARKVIADLAPLAFEKQQVVGLDAVAPREVKGDEALLSVMVRNLVDNAIRYSPDGASVVVRIEREGDSIILRVEDSGPGMVPADVARLGQRFFRVVGSGQRGSGLGWSIVLRVAAVHGADVQARAMEAPQAGMVVEARFASR